MKNLFSLFFIIPFFFSCNNNSEDVVPVTTNNPINNLPSIQFKDVPLARSFATFKAQNSATINGFIDNTNNYYQGPGTYKVGFIFRTGGINNSINERVIIANENTIYEPYRRYFNTVINSLVPNTKYFYTCFTKNGSYEKYDWKEFTTSKIPCTYSQNNYVGISGVWNTVNPVINDPLCCDEGNFGVRFGMWPNIYEINFNELNNGYPKTALYSGVDYAFDISDFNKEVVKSSNQVLIGENSTSATELFVNNDGSTLTIIFCNTTLRNGQILNGKLSVTIP
jgi:hypothetical protein